MPRRPSIPARATTPPAAPPIAARPKPTDPVEGPIPFPGLTRTGGRATPRDPAGEVLAAFAKVSRRINDLARELKCLGYFDDDEDRPRAA